MLGQWIEVCTDFRNQRPHFLRGDQHSSNALVNQSLAAARIPILFLIGIRV